jgi:hypothetical protein
MREMPRFLAGASPMSVLLITGWFVALVALASLFRFGVYGPWKSQQDGNWHPDTGAKMRRLSGEGWEYREMTPLELNAAKDDYDAKQY